jgi:hypothetical protein
VAFFEHLKPEHFQRFARVLLDVAQNPKASHRSRLRAVQAAIRPLRQAVTILPKLEKAGEPSLQAHLESLLIAFCRELSPDGFARLAAVLVELAGPAAKTTSDKLWACEVALTAVTDAMGMLSELRAMRRPQAPFWDMDDRKMRELKEQSAREIAEIRAETKARMEKDRAVCKGPAPGPPGSQRPG